MVKDAQEHETEDKKRREVIEARNQLESMVFSVQKHLDENREKIPEAERGALESAIKDARDVLEAKTETSDPAVFRDAFERLQKASHKMAEALYRAAGGTEGAQAGGGGAGGDGAGGAGGAPGAGGGKDDVIDAEYTEAPKA
jgi:molecular chaperone DnaK